MPEISLTDFVDFVIKAGTPKLTKVGEVKRRGAYDPAFDFWKQLRDGIQSFHRKGLSQFSDLQNEVGQITDRKKTIRYDLALKGYRKFLGRKAISWFAPPSDLWSFQQLNVRVNPELGLDINGQRYVIKLYFKDDAPTRNRIDVVLDMMRTVLSPHLHPGIVVGVLDVAKSKLHVPKSANPNIGVLLQAEAAAFLQIWNSIT